MENRINATLSAADRDAVLNAINQIHTLLPFLIDLTPDRTPVFAENGR